MTATTNGPGVAVVVVVLARILTSAEPMRRTLEGDPHAAISTPLRASQVPAELATVVRSAWAVAVGHDGSGPGALAVVQAITRALTVAELLRRQGTEPRRALAVPLRFGDLPRGLGPVVRDAWAFAVGLDDDPERHDDAAE
jgi:hypothetical protein